MPGRPGVLKESCMERRRSAAIIEIRWFTFHMDLYRVYVIAAGNTDRDLFYPNDTRGMDEILNSDGLKLNSVSSLTKLAGAASDINCDINVGCVACGRISTRDIP